RLLVQAYLSVRPGVSLRLAASAPEGLALAHESRPDLLLIDLMMPGMNGLQLLAAVRREPALNGVPCIALSANAMPEEIDAAMRAGFDGYLVKPVAADTLLAELDRRLAPQPSPA
ncbi:MAG TPA: response regulator, partial [Methylibium sp.]|nr:response regulator [Methylibium sp.]